MSSIQDQLLEPALAAVHEMDLWDFKRELDLTDNASMLEVIKDIVAFANSGGGVILVGVDDNGIVSPADNQGFFEVDPATITSKIYSYTGVHFHAFEFRKIQKDGQNLCAILVGSVDIPLVFTRPGTYSIGDNKQKSAFSQGTVYFRHGAKSEPGTSEDLRQFIGRYVEKMKAVFSKESQRSFKPQKGAE